MVRGIARRNTTKQAIFDFMKDEKWVGFEHIATHCKKMGIHRGTVKKYLDEIKRDGYAEQSPNGRHPYRLTKKGQHEAEQMRLKIRIDKATSGFIDEMPLEKIKAWLSRFEQRGIRLKFTDDIVVRDKDGKIKEKGVGIVYYTKSAPASEKHGIAFTFTVSDKDGKKLQAYEVDKDRKFVRKKG